MALDVESIWTAIEDRLREKLADSVKSVSRRVRGQYVEVELPVVVIRDGDGAEDLISDPDDPRPVWRISGDLWIFARVVETDTATTTQLNAVIKAVREAFAFDPATDLFHGRLTHYTNLGGAIRVLSIAKVEKGTGDVTGMPTAQMTITMETRPGA